MCHSIAADTHDQVAVWAAAATSTHEQEPVSRTQGHKYAVGFVPSFGYPLHPLLASRVSTASDMLLPCSNLPNEPAQQYARESWTKQLLLVYGKWLHSARTYTYIFFACSKARACPKWNMSKMPVQRSGRGKTQSAQAARGAGKDPKFDPSLSFHHTICIHPDGPLSCTLALLLLRWMCRGCCWLLHSSVGYVSLCALLSCAVLFGSGFGWFPHPADERVMIQQGAIASQGRC